MLREIWLLNMEPTEEDIDRCNRFLRGDIIFENAMKELIENFSQVEKN